MKEDWKYQMKRKLEDHRKEPPTGLWEGISNEMSLDATPSSKPAITRKLYWAAAAMVLALTGFFGFYNFDDAEPKLEARSEKAIKSSMQEESALPEEPSIPLKPKVPFVPSIQAKPSLLAMADKQHIIIEGSSYQEAVEELPVDSVEINAEPHAEPNQTKQTSLPDIVESVAIVSSSERSNKWTIGLAGSNGLLLAANDYVNSLEPVYYDASPVENMTNSFSGKNQIGAYTPYTLTNVVSNHHIPVRFGLSLQYQLNNRLALLSGINYTYLKSEFSFPLYNNLSYDQELQYLGIPFGLSWKIWANEHFHVYFTGGALIEKCVNADVSDGEINSRPWQWSVNAAAGAEYHITRQIGVYLEPSLGYYFNDGTSLEHYYKEHPLAPSIEFGVRLHLDK